MNVLEKAKLIHELNQLIDGLEQRSLSFFEIARSKARIKEIFALCDEPIFKKQILGTFILLFVTGLFFTSCSKNDNAKPAESPFTGMYGGGLVYKNETLYQGHFSITVAKDGSLTGSYSVYLTTPDTKCEVKGNVLKDG